MFRRNNQQDWQTEMSKARSATAGDLFDSTGKPQSLTKPGIIIIFWLLWFSPKIINAKNNMWPNNIIESFRYDSLSQKLQVYISQS